MDTGKQNNTVNKTNKEYIKKQNTKPNKQNEKTLNKNTQHQHALFLFFGIATRITRGSNKLLQYSNEGN